MIIVPGFSKVVDYLIKNMYKAILIDELFYSKIVYKINDELSISLNCYTIPQTKVHTMRNLSISTNDRVYYIYECDFKEMGHLKDFNILVDKVEEYLLEVSEIGTSNPMELPNYLVG